MPEDAPKAKLESTRAHGAKIITYNRQTEVRETIAAKILEETGGTLVPPFDHPMIMAGQGTAALELLTDAGQLDALITPVGGGGMLSGCSVIAKAMNPAIRIFGGSRKAPTTRSFRLRPASELRSRIPTPSPMACVLRGRES